MARTTAEGEQQMKAKVIADSALRLREAPGGEEIGRIPSGGVVEVLNWEADEKWAQIAYQGKVGYAVRTFLQVLEGLEERWAESAETEARVEAASQSMSVVRLRNVARGVFIGILVESAIAGLAMGIVTGDVLVSFLGLLIGLALGFVPAYVIRVFIDAKADLLEKAMQIHEELACIRRMNQEKRN